jgi:hypothetical protein
MARSRVTNGRDLLPNIDHRTLWVRRFRDVLALHLSDLGGEDSVSEAEKAIVRRGGMPDCRTRAAGAKICVERMREQRPAARVWAGIKHPSSVARDSRPATQAA